MVLLEYPITKGDQVIESVARGQCLDVGPASYL